MARVKRAKAAEMIGNLSDGLSDDLMFDEENARAAMEAVFIGAISPVADLLGEIQNQSDVDEVVVRVAKSAEAAVNATAGPFRVLLQTAVSKGLTGVRAELTVVERTLGLRYEGLAAASVLRVSRNKGEMLDFVSDQYLAGLAPALQWWRAQLQLELTTSVRLRESEKERLIRVVSPAPVRLPDHEGRGLWWKVLENCNRITRECEFAAVNTARNEAMVQFEAIGMERA